MLSGNYKLINKNNKVCIVTLVSPIEKYLFDSVNVVGTLKTENLGVERIIINTVSNTRIRAFIICGKESFGHYAGQALRSAWKNGVDKEGKIIGAKGPIPYLENIDEKAVQRFQEQILYMENLIGEENPEAVKSALDKLLKKDMPELGKSPLYVEGIGRKKPVHAHETKISGQLVVSEKIAIDPAGFRVMNLNK